MASEAVVRQDGAHVEVVVGFFDGEGHSPEGQKEQDGAGHEHVLGKGGGGTALFVALNRRLASVDFRLFGDESGLRSPIATFVAPRCFPSCGVSQ